MIKHKWVGPIAAILMAAAIFAMAFIYINPAFVAPIISTSEPAYVSAMDKTIVLDIGIIADEEAWADMLENATAEEYISATIVINGTKIKNVGIRPKGNSSLSMVAQDDTTDRFSFKIEFDHYITGQTWLGLDKIVLNNMQGDASYLKEYLSYDIMSYIGVASPLYTFADISLNGETWGLYLAVEALEDSYTQRIYGSNHGQLYKPESMGMRGDGQMNEFLQEMQAEDGWAPPAAPQSEDPAQADTPAASGELPGRQAAPGGGGGGGMGDMASGGVSLQYTDGDTSSYSAIFDNAVFTASESDRQRVVKALKTLAAGEELESAVDVEATLKYFAAHTVVVNLDSYVSGMGHNYYLYEADGQLTMLPWDYNLAFGGFQSGDASSVVNFPIDTPVSGTSLEERPMLGKLLEVPEYLTLYHNYLQQIVDGYFNSGLFEETTDAMSTLISPYVEADPTAFYDYTAYTAAAAELKELGLLRAKSIEGQLSGSIPSTSEGQTANPGMLVDASGIDLSLLGSQGGGMGGGIPGGGNMPEGDIPGNGLPAGSPPEDGFPDTTSPGGTGEDAVPGQGGPERGEFPGGTFPGSLPEGFPAGDGNTPQGQNPGFGGQPSIITAGFSLGSWILLGGCSLPLLLGLLFVIFYKRRRMRPGS